MNDFLAAYLDVIDERLLVHLNDEGELHLDTAIRLRRYTKALLDGSISPIGLAEEWPDWYLVAAAFVTVYAVGELGDLEDQTTFLDAVANGEEVALTDGDRAYLWSLLLHLGMYEGWNTQG